MVDAFEESIYLGFGPEGILRKEEILDQWASLIEEGSGHGEEIFEQTQAFLEASEAPGVRWERRQMSPGLVQTAFSEQREFLVVKDFERNRLKPYQIYTNARDYGRHLSVSRFLTFKPTIAQALLSLIPFMRLAPRSSEDLDLFESMDLRDFVTNAHRCLLKAVDSLVEELGQDVGKIDRKSKGVLEVW